MDQGDVDLIKQHYTTVGKPQRDCVPLSRILIGLEAFGQPP
jgi:hypothetical protein